ncbi:hypothetical protein [Thiocystis violacea]|uniref:hypothetical protein n=1 Tax=Thiocystis violacea TaxID=13725 RepID=UPI001904C205|nr:hypothetical protein [Thiocystis violacea]
MTPLNHLKTTRDEDTSGSATAPSQENPEAASGALAILYYEDAQHPAYWVIAGDEDQARAWLERLERLQADPTFPCPEGLPESGFSVIDVLAIPRLMTLLGDAAGDRLTMDHLAAFAEQ